MARDLARIVPLKFHPDNRGMVYETYRESWGNVDSVRQMTASASKQGTLRGMHFHRRQTDVWTFLAGQAVIYLYDPFLNRGQRLITQGHETIIIPPFVAHGAYSMTDTLLLYGLTNEYDNTDEYGFNFFDPKFPYATELDAGGGVAHISERDINAKSLKDFLAEQDELDLADSSPR